MRITFVTVLTLALTVGAAAQQPSPGQAINEAERAARVVDDLRADPEMERLLDSDSSLKKKLQQAQSKLSLAHEALASGRPYAQGEAREFAIAGRRELDAVANALRGKWERARAAEALAREAEQEEALRRSLRAEADELASEARELLALPAPADDAILERRGAVGRALKAYEALGRDASAAAIAPVRDRLAEATDALAAVGLPPAARTSGRRPTSGTSVEAARHPAPEKLRRAIEAFIAGDFAKAADLLAVAELGDDHATGAAHLVRGAALFALYVESGERDRSLLERAIADVRACQRLDPSLTPTRSLFSPRFAELFATADAGR